MYQAASLRPSLSVNTRAAYCALYRISCTLLYLQNSVYNWYARQQMQSKLVCIKICAGQFGIHQDKSTALPVRAALAIAAAAAACRCHCRCHVTPAQPRAPCSRTSIVTILPSVPQSLRDGEHCLCSPRRHRRARLRQHAEMAGKAMGDWVKDWARKKRARLQAEH